MEYQKKDGKVIGKLDSKNVDMGAGFERITAIVQGKEDAYSTDLFSPILEKINSLSKNKDEMSSRIIADHIRTSVILISDGVIPSNTDQGYVLRRLLRRAIRKSDVLGIEEHNLSSIVDAVAEVYDDIYTNIRGQQEYIENIIDGEETKFRKTLADGIKHFAKITTDSILSGEDAFKLFSTYGFPFELTKELAHEKGIKINEEEFKTELEKHQQQSRTASAGKFKGGLAGHGEMETKYHTATHLLHSALRSVLGEHVMQKGSNITAERLRFDFSHNEKMTEEQIKNVENIVNNAISNNLEVTRKEMPLDEAKKLNAIGLFGEKYGDVVSVYTIGNFDNPFSREFCGGPHVSNTGTLGKFKILKEEASSAGIRRIKAILE